MILIIPSTSTSKNAFSFVPFQLTSLEWSRSSPGSCLHRCCHLKLVSVQTQPRRWSFLHWPPWWWGSLRVSWWPPQPLVGWRASLCVTEHTPASKEKANCYYSESLFAARDVTRSHGTRYTFCSVYIRAAQLIVKRSRFKYPCDLIPERQWFSYVYYNCFTSRVSVDREKHVLSLPMLMNQRVGHHHASDVNAVIHWYGRRQNTYCSRSTNTCFTS